jgi:radical SAM-linked protein
MSRYAFKFYKVGNMRFISHLDLQRLFIRAMRRAGIDLVYSLGYNPHPKISIVQPLSLGFESTCDYFEIETAAEENIEEMISAVNAALPEGIKFFEGKALPLTIKSLSSIVEFSSYEVHIPLNNTTEVQEKLSEFNLRNIVTVNKLDKKTKKSIKKDIKPMIRSAHAIAILADSVDLHTVLRSASNESLNPLHLAEAFCEFLGQPYNRNLCRVCRKDIYVLQENELLSLGNFI